MKLSAAACAILVGPRDPRSLSFLAGCATAVYHPKKIESEMRADVDTLRKRRQQNHWMTRSPHC